MAKKGKLNIEKILNRVNKEYEKTAKQIDKMVKDASEQIDLLQHQIQDPIKKLLEDAEKVREREVKRFHEEFDRRVKEFTDLQQSILDKIGIQKNKTVTKTEKPVVSKKAIVAKETTIAKEKKSAKKNVAAKSTAPKSAVKKAVKDSNLTMLSGVGPATAKQMNAAGITSIKQIASPTATEQKVLEGFAKVKGSEGWQEQAKALLA